MNLGLDILGVVSLTVSFDSVPPGDSPVALVDGLAMVPNELRRGVCPVILGVISGEADDVTAAPAAPTDAGRISRALSKAVVTGCGGSSSVSGTAGILPSDCRRIRCVLTGVFFTFFGNSSPGFKIRVVAVPSAFRIITLR